jgi:hypothetical protein
MVFSYFRDAWNYYFGNRYPRPELVFALKERGSDQPKSTAVVLHRETHVRLTHQPILRPLEESEIEAWVETHPSQSVCVRRLQIHEEF